MARGARSRPQTALWERIIEDEELEKALELREKMKGDAAAATKRLEDANDKARAKISALDIADAPVRVGRFIVSQKNVAGRTVESFETKASTRLRVKLVPEDLQ